MNHKYIFITVRASKTFDANQVSKLSKVIVTGFKAKIYSDANLESNHKAKVITNQIFNGLYPLNLQPYIFLCFYFLKSTV